MFSKLINLILPLPYSDIKLNALIIELQLL